MYTVKEVSKKYNIKENTILNAIRTNKLTAKKVGKSYRITPDAIETYLGLSDNNEVFKLHQEIEKLKLEIEGYKMQLANIKTLNNTISDLLNYR